MVTFEVTTDEGTFRVSAVEGHDAEMMRETLKANLPGAVVETVH